jgi:bacterial leucyl aminopeptidase
LQDFANSNIQAAAVTFPSSVTKQSSVKPLLPKLNKANVQSNLEKFVSYQNRYYKSATGKQSSEWLLNQVQSIISSSNATTNASARAFTHSWGQNSVIATIPGKSSNIVVIGAHQDSINQNNPSLGRAPGADDDGSGSMTILEAMRVLLTDTKVAAGQAQNTIDFHWYSAEEAGLLGSQAIFQDYKSKGKVVKAMLQQDMTGYVKAGVDESVGVITDYVDAGLTDFIKKVVTAVSPSLAPNIEHVADLTSIATFRTLRPSADTPAQTTQARQKQATQAHLSSRLRSKIRVSLFTATGIPSALSTLTI